MSVRRRAAGLLRAAPEQEALVDVAAGLRPADIARRFWPRLRPLRGWLLLGLLLLTAAPAIAVAEAFLYQRLVDDVLVPAAFEPLLALALLYIGLNLASGVVSGADDYLATLSRSGSSSTCAATSSPTCCRCRRRPTTVAASATPSPA